MIRRALARSLIGLLALAPLLPVATGRAAPRRPTSRVAQAVDPENRTDPAPEQTVSLAADEDEGIGAPTDDSVPDLEERLYLRERPDSLGAAAREYRDERIAELLAQREALAHERRLEAIALLERFLATEPETAPEIPDALLRLAELRWELARLEYLRAFADFQARPEGQRGVEPTIDYSVPLALYERILVRHRDFDRRDLVLYMKGYALLDSGQTNQALDAYRTILRDHPESRFVPDSHFALAEDAFTNRVAYRDALAEYEAVLRYPRSELYDIALFKSAWCLWRLGRNQDAALRFRQVLDLGAQTEGLTAEQRRRLRDLEDEALDYLIQVFTEDESNTARDVFRFLQEIGGERYANRVMRRLADTYMSQGRQERAVEAYGFLLEMEPEAAEAPDYQRTIAAAYVQMGELDRAVEALRTLATTYGPDSRWASQQGDPEVVARAERRTEKAIRRQALRFHESGQRDNQNATLERAVALYALYEEHFGDRPEAYEIAFYRAEILFHRLHRNAEAGDAYVVAARKNPQGRYTRDALYNAISAYERVREQELAACAGPAAPRPGSAPAQSAAGATPPACPETENDRKFASTLGLYVELFPDDPDIPEILFRQGRLYYDRGMFDPAVRLFGELLEHYPRSQFASTAGELVLDSFNRAEDYANIEAWARRLKESPAFASAESQRRLDGLILQSVFKSGEQLAGRGEHAAAAAAYLRAAEEFPQDPRARQALYNAGLERQRAGDLRGAEQAYDRLVDRYPGTAEGALGAWTAAQMFESIAQFRDAADYYARYGERFPQGEKAADAMYNAVLLRVTAGEWDEAITSARAFLERFPRHESVDDVTFFMGRAHEGAERWRDAANVYRDYTRRSRDGDRKVEAFLRLGVVLDRAEQHDEANAAYDEAVRLGKRNRRSLEAGLYYAAEARYRQGEAVIHEYEGIRIAGSMDGLRERLQRKSELLQRAAVIFADVVSFGVAEWVTASLYQIGRSYELFAKAMRGFEIPDGLSQEEQDSYRDQLAAFIIPMEERALEAYDGGYRKALELRIYNRWTAQLREALTRLNDVQYPPTREIGVELERDLTLPMPQPLDGLERPAATAPSEGEGR